MGDWRHCHCFGNLLEEGLHIIVNNIIGQLKTHGRLAPLPLFWEPFGGRGCTVANDIIDQLTLLFFWEYFGGKACTPLPTT